MKSFLVETDMGQATLTYANRSVTMNYEDGTEAFNLNFVVNGPEPTEDEKREAYCLVFNVLSAYKVQRAYHIASELLDI